MPTLDRPQSPTFIKPGVAPRSSGADDRSGRANGPLTVAVMHRRGSALFWDLLLTGKVSAFSTLIVLLVGEAAGVEHDVVWSDGVFDVGLLVAIMAWLVLLPVLSVRFSAGRQASISKSRSRVRVVRTDGRALTPGIAFVRALVAATPVWVGVGLVTLLQLVGMPGAVAGAVAIVALVLLTVDLAIAPLFGDLRQTLHDRIAGTVVVSIDGAVADETPRPIDGRPRGADQVLVVALVLAFCAWMGDTEIASLFA